MMFGTVKPRLPMPALPGPISGYGGGTFNMDGTVATEAATPAARLPANFGLFGSRPKLPAARQAQEPPLQPASGHWSIDGFDQMREDMQVPQQTLGSQVLGGSMRQPIDYDALAAKLLPEQKKPSTLKRIGMALIPALMAANGNQAGANQFIGMMAGQRREDENYRRDVMLKLADMKYRDFSRQNEADLRASNPFTIGRDRLQFDPATGQMQTLYNGPQDFEEYAAKLGLEPGTAEYFKAVEDYVLKSSGPSAHERDVEMDDRRTQNDEHLEGVRYGNRVSMEGLRQGNRREMEGIRQGNRLQVRNTPRPGKSAGGLLGGSKGDIPTVKTPEEASLLPPGTRFRTPDGRLKVAR